MYTPTNFYFEIHPEEKEVAPKDAFWSFMMPANDITLLTGLLGEDKYDIPLKFVNDMAKRTDIVFGTGSAVSLTIQFYYPAQTGLTEFLVQGYNGTGLITVQCPTLNTLSRNPFTNFKPSNGATVKSYRTEDPKLSYFHLDPKVDATITNLTASLLLNPLKFFEWLSKDERKDPNPQIVVPNDPRNPTKPDGSKSARIYQPKASEGFLYTVHTVPVKPSFLRDKRLIDLMQCIKGIGNYTNDPTQVSPYQAQQARWFV